MSEDLNSVELVGRLTRKPELRVTQSGLNVVSFSLTVTRAYADANGDHQADFPNCVAWRKNAEYLSKYGDKGQVCSVHGNLQTRSYQDKDGKKVYVTEVQCDHVGLGAMPKNSGQSYGRQAGSTNNRYQGTTPQDPFKGNSGNDGGDLGDLGDQLPF